MDNADRIEADWKLPCDVFLAPRTVFRKGVDLRTLLVGMLAFDRPGLAEYRLTKHSANEDALPRDVVRLVIAARRIMDENASAESRSELDQAAEAFASRVPWENEDEA